MKQENREQNKSEIWNPICSSVVGQGAKWCHMYGHALSPCANYLNTTVCMLVHIHTHLHWLQMQYILLLLSKTLITLHSFISHKYSKGRAVIRTYIYPTWLGENTVQCWPQGWASPTRLRCQGWNQDTSGHTWAVSQLRGWILGRMVGM